MFWSGNNWTYLNNLTVLSHINVGHEVVLWLHGDLPKSDYWCDYDITIKNADDIININDFIKSGGNFKTASSLFRWNLLYKIGGWYSDTDAIAINHWPDSEYIICGEYSDNLSTGVIKAPSGDKMFLDMIQHIKKDWGNVNVFNDVCIKHRGNNNATCDYKLFYPFDWKNWDIWLDKYSKIFNDCYSIHLYHTMFERSNMIKCITDWMDMHPESLLSTIDRIITR